MCLCVLIVIVKHNNINSLPHGLCDTYEMIPFSVNDPNSMGSSLRNACRSDDFPDPIEPVTPINLPRFRNSKFISDRMNAAGSSGVQRAVIFRVQIVKLSLSALCGERFMCA